MATTVPALEPAIKLDGPASSRNSSNKAESNVPLLEVEQ